MLRKIVDFMTGTIGAQIIALVFTPLVTRLYAPEQYGYFTLYLSMSVIISSFSTLKLDQAIYKVGFDINKNQTLMRVIFSLLFLVVMALAVIGGVIGYFTNKHYLFYILFGVLSLSLYDITIALSVNMHNIKEIRNYRLLQSIVIGVGQVVFYYIFHGYIGLILGHLIGYLLFFLMVNKTNKTKLQLTFDIDEYKQVYAMFGTFIKYQAPASLLNSLAQNLIVIALAYCYGEHQAGLFGLTYKVLALPNAMLGNAVRQIFYKHAEEIKNNSHKLNSVYNRITLILLMISVTGFGIGYLTYDYLFPLAFGDRWSGAAEISKLLTPWFILMLINSPSITIFNILDKQKKYFYFELMNTISRVAVIMVPSILSNDFYLMIKLYVAQAVFMNILIILMAKYELLCKIKKEYIV